ncbi:DUF4445 domain-containing protein [bacterium]|nr:DUF4445 domain-containing protein [bacterium]
MGKVFFPQFRRGREGIKASQDSILDHARRLGVEIASECGGLGKCGRCLIRVEKGSRCLNEKTEEEKKHSLGKEERLACQARVINPTADICVFIRDFGKYSILSESIETTVELNSFVIRKGDRVSHHSGEDLGPYGGELFGLAIDVGTTTLVTQLIDLEDGRTIATLARKNPQISYGNDVISRIGYTMSHEGGLGELQKTVMKVVNDSLEELEREKGEIRKYIYDVVAVGNSTMRSIFFGQDVSSLGVIPFEPLSPVPIGKKAPDIGLAINPGGNVYGPPLIGGHAGADALADILASRMYEDENVVMLIDIGTNGEVAVGNKDRIMTASCAAGGAYEGATIRCGVGAIEGAIKNIWMSDHRVDYETIGGKPPVGICGSGLIDLLAELLRKGIMSKTAKLKKEFFVAEDISITQQDIYQLITAKAGLRLDQDLLIKYYGITLEGIEKIYLAGAFGNYINSESAVSIGLLPPAAEKVVKIGNGALAGAREMLLSQKMRAKAEEVVGRIEHIKPNEREKDFAYMVAEKMYF